ncbi:hypothetical protein JW921_10035 [Candidatus Fermentibacterales bacterium]|nr:hypothetical protein [Candidatus Fermentibacterales bacterium]
MSRARFDPASGISGEVAPGAPVDAGRRTDDRRADPGRPGLGEEEA